MSVTMTRDQMLAALAEAARRVPGGAEGLTTNEVAAALGVHLEKAREAVRVLIGEGRMQPVKVRRVGLDGRNGLVSGYQFVPGKRK